MKNSFSLQFHTIIKKWIKSSIQFSYSTNSKNIVALSIFQTKISLEFLLSCCKAVLALIFLLSYRWMPNVWVLSTTEYFFFFRFFDKMLMDNNYKLYLNHKTNVIGNRVEFLWQLGFLCQSILAPKMPFNALWFISR